jgi:hypothetical protein
VSYFKAGLLLLLLPLISGCYTVIHHQPVTEQVGYYSDCRSCHHDRVEDYCVEEAYLFSGYNYSGFTGPTNYSYFNDSAWWWYYSDLEDVEEGESTDSPVTRILRRRHVSISPAIMSAVNQVTVISSEGDSDDDEEDEEEQSPRKKLKRRRR